MCQRTNGDISNIIQWPNLYSFLFYFLYCPHTGGRSRGGCTPSPPTKSFPTKSPRVKLSGRLPINFNGHKSSHPLELRVCLSQTF